MNYNFRNYGDNHTWDAMGGKAASQANVTLTRQSSIYSLTFDELQSTMGGTGKDFGSMNMDELLKNIWTAEETQSLGFSGGGGDGHINNNNNNNSPSGGLQRQGSLTLPRTLSQKTVDEVWRDLIKEDTNGAKNGSGGSSMPHRQPTLGEMTLEEFLVRAGVVREDLPHQQMAKPTNNNNGWFGGGGDFPRPNNNTGLLFGFQQRQLDRNNGNFSERVVEGNTNNNNLVPKQPPPPPPLSLNSNQHSHHRQTQQQQQHPPPLFPKPTTVAFAPPPMHLLNNAQLTSPGRRGGLMGVGDQHPMNGSLAQSNVGMVGLAANVNITAAGGSPSSKISNDVVVKKNVDTSPLSPVHYVINRGRKNSAVEKVVERRQRRMIKNRESAARSRARKQAYTFELEAEVAKLKELNSELQRKQEEIMERQKNKDLDPECRPRISKIQCLRRTLTGPW